MDHWKITEAAGNIVITCFGHDKHEQFLRAIQQFDALVGKRRESFQVIADLREMTGYDSGARRAWQEAFRQQRRLMRSVIFVGARSRGIRMGAAVVGAVAGVPVRFVETWSEVDVVGGGKSTEQGRRPG